ncbi:DEKNAAC104278 [Brettanomyces naardenensis]|uniref:Ubiquitin-activating enzyme E1-like n=1 Tax=Brettanomyces naardenensis TaxID=13370 RepID=A0A448YQA9_BRENA|nr:DEKNAAC104278 [Brettanomyces naardenensis]
MNYGEIHVLDLDTIDLSNLNRQFLFRQKDIKASKALTAVKAVQHMNHASKLVAHHGNIMDTKQFPLSFFQGFDMIFNALDNLEARMYVNKVCLFTKVPLMESGTTGLQGQVQPIYPYLTECFACVPKSTPKAFPVCTIRSTPSKPVHCVTWAKNFLFPQLFGPGSSDLIPTKGQNEDDDEDDDETKNSLQEANELIELKFSIVRAAEDLGDSPDYSFVDSIITKIFTEDILRLLRMENLWTSRSKPTPLNYSEYSLVIKNLEDSGLIEDVKLSDQKIGSILENLQTFVKSTIRLTKRLRLEKEIYFDKDDQDALEFVSSSSNLRSYIFDIPLKTEFEVKQIAGNIIPAVATTNAIMAGFSALSSIHYFISGKNSHVAAEASRMVYDSSVPERFVNTSKLAEPNKNCKQCSIVRGIANLDIGTLTLSKFRQQLIEKYHYEDDVAIATSDSRLLYDFDFEDNLERPLKDFIRDGDVLLVSDSEEILDHIELLISDHEGEEIRLPDLTIPPFREQQEEEEEGEEDDEIVAELGNSDGIVILDEEENPLKRSNEETDESSPIKKRKIDNLVVLD